jgi:hypothetical protein
MDTKELAALLNGNEYGEEISRELEALAKEAGLVVVFGASDDLVEFKGALSEEIGASAGGTVTVDQFGLTVDWDDIEDEDRSDIDFMRDWFKREGIGQTIEALWDKEEPYSWTFETDIPHETFEIMEDGKPFCRGIVFALKDISALP